MKKGRVCSFLTRLLAVSLCLCGSLSAQVANNTTLVGTVTDANGAAISGANVTAVNVATNDTYTGTTNEEGSYTISFIREGVYSITVEHAGFSKLTQKGILVEINKTVRTDFSLTVGAVTESVVVD